MNLEEIVGNGVTQWDSALFTQRRDIDTNMETKI